ncbi:MAG: hypothetical protein NTV48_02325 [Candidatus Vogelbacteria bacterium]|nr:hypothetical protein [Candidatus Vogelbacteria bacterium]
MESFSLKNTLRLSRLFILIVIFGLFLLPKVSYGWDPFGGMVIMIIDCDCSNNEMIIHTQVAGPNPIMYEEGKSKLYEFKKIQVAEWLLGNVVEPVKCVKKIGGYCINLGSYPLIKIVGTSGGTDTGEPDSGNNSGTNTGVKPPVVANPPLGAGKPVDNTNDPTCAEGNVTPASQGKTEAQVRSELESKGVHIENGLSPTLSPVSKLPNNAIAGVEDLARDCGSNCNIVISSGARQAGNSTAPGNHGTGKPVFDLQKNPGLNNYITSNSTNQYTTSAGTYYQMPNGDSYLDENSANTGGTGPHWHVKINDNHMVDC